MPASPQHDSHIPKVGANGRNGDAELLVGHDIENPGLPLALGDCVIVGGAHLAIDCAEQLLAVGHSLRVVLATDLTFETWCRERLIPCVQNLDELTRTLERLRPTWLFSIGNPLILPSELLCCVADAFNYHDAPLPLYAGSHATSWALINQEDHFAVSWHRMAASVDAGDVAVQVAVDIAPNDTALTLNLKCVAAAARGFKDLLARLGAGALVLTEQDLRLR